MDLFTLLRIMLRRWWVAVPVLIIAGAVSYRLVDSRAIEFSTVGSQLMVGPQTPTTGLLIAPDVAATVLSELLNPSTVRRHLETSGYDVAASIGLSATGTAVNITTSGQDPSEVVAAATSLTELAPNLLTEALGTDSSSIRLTVVNEPNLADVNVGESGSTLETAMLVLPVSETQTNPFPPTLGTVRSLLEVSRTADIAGAVADRAPTARYDVSSELRDAAPIIRITVVASTPDDAAVGYEAVRDGISEQLVLLQEEAGVPASQQTVLRDLATPSGVGQTSASVVRPVAGVVVLGLGVALALAVIVDALLIRRRKPVPAPEVEPTLFESIPPPPINQLPPTQRALPAPRGLPSPPTEQR